MIHISGVDALTDRSGLLVSHCSPVPKIPRASTIQNRISDPTNGVTMNGKSVRNIVGPLSALATELTATAIKNPKMIVSGVTTKV